jgi:hypothetical protein
MRTDRRWATSSIQVDAMIRDTLPTHAGVAAEMNLKERPAAH